MTMVVVVVFFLLILHTITTRITIPVTLNKNDNQKHSETVKLYSILSCNAAVK